MGQGEIRAERAASRGRIAFYFAVRYATPALVVAALAVSGRSAEVEHLTGLLTIQIGFALLTHAIVLRTTTAIGPALWLGMITDVAAISGLVAITGGIDGPLAFLFVIHALAAGILLSSRAGVRMLVLASVAILSLDVVAGDRVTPGRLPEGLMAVAVVWMVGGAGTLFSSYNERELRRRNAELATIRRVTLDMEDSLTLEEIFDDLSRGVVEAFGFDAAAVLLRDGGDMRCVAAHGITGAHDARIELRGRVAHALALAAPVVTPGSVARADGTLLPLLGPRGYLAVPLAEDGMLIATREGGRGRAGKLRAHEIDALDSLAHHARLAVANARLHAKVHSMAVTDPLTGLANHGELQRRLTFEAGRLERFSTLKGQGHRMSVILLDIDHFKKFNDRFGHQAGDAVLKGVSAALRRSVRTFDIVARYGGEEFAIILPEAAVEAAQEVAERVRRAVSAYPFAPTDGGKPVRVTVSAGIATAPDNGKTPARLIQAADIALYVSKKSGRDRVTHACDVEPDATKVVAMATRRRKGSSEGPARGGARRARARSSLPTRRTPRA